MLSQVGTGYALKVSSGVLLSATSNPITLIANNSGPPKAPVLTLNLANTNYATTFQSGGVAIENTSGVTINDNTTLTGATIQIESLRDGSNESLTVNPGVTGMLTGTTRATVR